MATRSRHSPRRNLRRGQGLPREAPALEEVVADRTLENRLLKKHDPGLGRRGMKYSASDKTEITPAARSIAFACSVDAEKARHSGIVV